MGLGIISDKRVNTGYVYSDFPVGQRVQVKQACVDMHFFFDNFGTVVKNRGGYLGVIVNVEWADRIQRFNFHPKDLIPVDSAGEKEKYTSGMMRIDSKQEGDIVLFEIYGRIGLEGGVALKERVATYLDQGKTKFLFNLAKVDFINSSGLGSFISITKEIRLKQGRLVLSNMQAYPREIFEITQLLHIFEVYTTQEAAVKSFEV